MKKLFLISVFFLTACYSFAEFTIGIKAGYNASKLSINPDTITSNFKSGFNAGIFIRFGKKLYIQPELYYTSQGGVFTSNFDNWKQNIKLGSLDVPVLVGFKIINNDNLNLRILAGPMASFIVNKTISEEFDSEGPITSADINSVNWAIQAGAGVDVWKFTLDVRYQVGLSKLIKDVQSGSGGSTTFNSY
ncbi:MAG: porin family protein, partial [bacterium]